MVHVLATAYASSPFFLHSQHEQQKQVQRSECLEPILGLCNLWEQPDLKYHYNSTVRCYSQCQ